MVNRIKILNLSLKTKLQLQLQSKLKLKLKPEDSQRVTKSNAIPSTSQSPVSHTNFTVCPNKFFLLSTLLLAIPIAAISGSSWASSITLHVGPPSLGGGGPNPIGIPPSAKDFELVYLTDKNTEISIGTVPGILYGVRSGSKSGGYVSAGGGILVNPNIIGLGLYTAFGYTTKCKSFCFNAEYKQAIGVYSGRIFTLYAVRAGIAYLF